MKKWGKRNAALLCALTLLSSTTLAWAGTNTESSDGTKAAQADKNFSISQGTDKNSNFSIWFGNVQLKRNGNDSYSLMTTAPGFDAPTLLNANQLNLSKSNSIEGGISMRVGKQVTFEAIGMKDFNMSASKNVSSADGAYVNYYHLYDNHSSGQPGSFSQSFEEIESATYVAPTESDPGNPTGTKENTVNYDYKYNITLPAEVTSKYTSDLKGREFNLRWTVPDNKRLTLLAGFRNITLNEGLAMNAAFTPTTDVNRVKAPSPDTISTSPIQPFTDSYSYATKNNAWGPQVGLTYALIQAKKWNLNILGKAGIYSNKITTTGSATVNSIGPITRGSGANGMDSATVTPTSYSTNESTTSTSTALEAGLQLTYRFNASTDLNIGYKWIKYGGFATAPGQVRYTDLTCGKAIIDTSDLEYTALTAGITYKF